MITRFFLIAFALCFYHLAFANEGVEPLTGSADVSLSTAVFQAGGFNTEGTHPLYLTHASTEEIVQALAKTYESEVARKNRPDTIEVLIPNTLENEEALSYGQEIERQLAESGLRDLRVVLVAVPVTETVSKGEMLIAKASQALSEPAETTIENRASVQKFLNSLKEKITHLKLWAQNFKNWRTWKAKFKGRWNQKTMKEKDQAILTIFGAARGLPGVWVYANDAGINPINIARMVISYAADIFFTVAPQKLAELPAKLQLPDFKDRTLGIISWGLSFGLMTLGYAGNEIHPANLQYQLSQALPSIREWFAKNIELKSFLFNYSLSLGIPLTFLSLGYFAKGGSDSGAMSPFDLSFLFEFAGLQIVDGLMGMLAGRGARVLGNKGVISGRQENIFYSLLNVLGQIQGLGVATGHTAVYRTCLVVKSAIQGLTFLVSRLIPPKTPSVLIFHGSIGSRDLESYLYAQGLMEPKKIINLDQMLTQISAETSGPSTLNRWLAALGSIFIKDRWQSALVNSKKSSQITENEALNQEFTSDHQKSCHETLKRK